MKHSLLPLAALALLAASCDTHTGDSYTTVNFGEMNFVIDNENPGSEAGVTPSFYYTKLNWSKNTAEISTSDLVADGKKISFDTNPMQLLVGSVKDPYSEYYVSQGSFSSKENVGKGATVTDLAAVYTAGVYNATINIPGLSALDNTGIRLVLGYTLNDRFKVQTFWPDCYYLGDTGVFEGGPIYNTTSTIYRVRLDFNKKLAKVVICYPKYDDVEKDVPQAIVMSDMPITLGHSSYSIASGSPKTEILVTSAGKSELKDPGKYQVTDFSFALTSSDMTEARIAFKINGKEIAFNGCSIVKQKKP